jgi:rhamnogalacturonan endolyase
MKVFAGLITFLSLWAHVATAAFGYTSSGGYYTIDAGSSNPFVFKVNQANCDITSLVYRGVEVKEFSV